MPEEQLSRQQRARKFAKQFGDLLEEFMNEAELDAPARVPPPTAQPDPGDLIQSEEDVKQVDEREDPRVPAEADLSKPPDSPPPGVSVDASAGPPSPSAEPSLEDLLVPLAETGLEEGEAETEVMEHVVEIGHPTLHPTGFATGEERIRAEAEEKRDLDLADDVGFDDDEHPDIRKSREKGLLEFDFHEAHVHMTEFSAHQLIILTHRLRAAEEAFETRR